jgi:hypothetical protein
MVNTLIVHPNPYVRLRPELPWPPPSSDEGKDHTRAIPARVWPLQKFIEIAQGHLAGKQNTIIAVTNDCQEDMQEHLVQYDDVAEIICLLTDDDYHNSLWCKRSRRPGVQCAPEAAWLPCDAYVISIDREDGSESTIEYYLKMCQTTLGTVLLLISIHPAEYAK